MNPPPAAVGRGARLRPKPTSLLDGGGAAGGTGTEEACAATEAAPKAAPEAAAADAGGGGGHVRSPTARAVRALGAEMVGGTGGVWPSGRSGWAGGPAGGGERAADTAAAAGPFQLVRPRALVLTGHAASLVPY